MAHHTGSYSRKMPPVANADHLRKPPRPDEALIRLIFSQYGAPRDRGQSLIQGSNVVLTCEFHAFSSKRVVAPHSPTGGMAQASMGDAMYVATSAGWEVNRDQLSLDLLALCLAVDSDFWKALGKTAEWGERCRACGMVCEEGVCGGNTPWCPDK